MDDDFRILFDYVEQMKRELAEKDKADLQTKSAEDEEKKCVHESIETEEAYVCCKPNIRRIWLSAKSAQPAKAGGECCLHHKGTQQ